MKVRSEVFDLKKLGRLPLESNATPQDVKRFEELIREITTPVTDDEARILVDIFGEDDCFGLAASLVARIETAPSWPITDSLKNVENLWIKELLKRAGLPV